MEGKIVVVKRGLGPVMRLKTAAVALLAGRVTVSFGMTAPKGGHRVAPYTSLVRKATGPLERLRIAAEALLLGKARVTIKSTDMEVPAVLDHLFSFLSPGVAQESETKEAE